MGTTVKIGYTNMGGGVSLINNIIYRIAIPTLLFAFITYIPKVYLRDEGYDVMEMLRQVFVDGTYWFTCALVIAELIIFVMLLFRWTVVWKYFVSALFVTIIAQFLFLNHVEFCGGISSPWYYKSGMTACLFLASGGVYWKYEEVIDNHVKPLYLIIIAIISSYVLIMDFLKIQCVISRGALDLPGFLIDIATIYIFIRACKFVPYSRMIEYVGRHSIGFYFFCGAIPNVTWIIMRMIGFEPSVIVTLMGTVLSILIAYPIVTFLNRTLPFMFDLRKIRIRLNK